MVCPFVCYQNYTKSFQAIFMKLCKIIGSCCGKNALNFGVDPTQTGRLATGIFTARAYARAVLGVVILSVCVSVTRVDCDKSKWCTADILIAHERAITLLL